MSPGPGAIRGLYLFYGCEFASSEQSPDLPPRLTHARNSQPPNVPSHIRRTREGVITIPSTSRMLQWVILDRLCQSCLPFDVRLAPKATFAPGGLVTQLDAGERANFGPPNRPLRELETLNRPLCPSSGSKARLRQRSELGHSHHFWPVRRMSAYPLTAARAAHN